jgi:hypothetical protein
MIEAARKHGPFDPRFAPTRSTSRFLRESNVACDGSEARLDAQAFRTRFFGACGRHDMQALAAYEAYRTGFESAGTA